MSVNGNRLKMLCPISSANWNNGSMAGVWYLNLNNVRANSNNNIGFRSDFEPPRTSPCIETTVEQRETFSGSFLRNRSVIPFLVGLTERQGIIS